MVYTTDKTFTDSKWVECSNLKDGEPRIHQPETVQSPPYDSLVPKWTRQAQYQVPQDDGSRQCHNRTTKVNSTLSFEIKIMFIVSF